METSLKEMRLIDEVDYIKFRVVNNDINTFFAKLENHIKELYSQFFQKCKYSTIDRWLFIFVYFLKKENLNKPFYNSILN